MSNDAYDTPKTWPLAVIISLHCTWITLGIMLANAVIDILLKRGSVQEIFGLHLLHVLILSIAIAIAITGLIQREIGRPIGRINAILYRLGAGDTDFPSLNTRIQEVRKIEEGIQNMRNRMFSDSSGELMKKSVAALTEIRDIAKELRPMHPEESRRLLDSVLTVAESLSVARYHPERKSSL